MADINSILYQPEYRSYDTNLGNVSTTLANVINKRYIITNSGVSGNSLIITYGVETAEIFDGQSYTFLFDGTNWFLLNTATGAGEGLDNYIENGRFESNLKNWTAQAGLTLSLDTTTPIYGRKSMIVTKNHGGQETKKVFYPFSIYDSDKNKVLNFRCIFKPDANYLNAYTIKIVDEDAVVVAENILEVQQLPISDFSILFTTTNNSNYTLIIECSTNETEEFSYSFDNFYVGEVVVATTTDSEIQPVGTLIPYAGNKDTLDENLGWLFADYRAVSQTTYSDLFSKIGFSFSKDASDAATMVSNGTFRVPDGRGKVPRGAYNAVIQSINTSTDIITLSEQVFTRAGTPVKFHTVGGVLPTIGGSTVNVSTVYFVGVISGSTIKLYDTEKNAITGGATGLIDFDGNVTGTVILSSCGVYEEDAFQGWQVGAENAGAGANKTMYGYCTDNSDQRNDTSAVTGYGGIGSRISYQGLSSRLKAVDDGTNGTLRTSNVTRDTSFSANWIIRWKQQATASFFKTNNILKEAGKTYRSYDIPNGEGLNFRGDIALIGGSLSYPISKYPDLFINGAPINEAIIDNGDTTFSVIDTTHRVSRGAITSVLTPSDWNIASNYINLKRSDIPSGTPVKFKSVPSSIVGVVAETTYYLSISTNGSVWYKLHNTENNANAAGTAGMLVLSGTVPTENCVITSIGCLSTDAIQNFTGTHTLIATSVNNTATGVFSLAGSSVEAQTAQSSVRNYQTVVDIDASRTVRATKGGNSVTRDKSIHSIEYLVVKNTPVVIYNEQTLLYKKDEILTRYTLTANAQITVTANNLSIYAKVQNGCNTLTLLPDTENEPDRANKITITNDKLDGSVLLVTDGTRNYSLALQTMDFSFYNGELFPCSKYVAALDTEFLTGELFGSALTPIYGKMFTHNGGAIASGGVTTIGTIPATADKAIKGEMCVRAQDGSFLAMFPINMGNNVFVQLRVMASRNVVLYNAGSAEAKSTAGHYTVFYTKTA